MSSKQARSIASLKVACQHRLTRVSIESNKLSRSLIDINSAVQANKSSELRLKPGLKISCLLARIKKLKGVKKQGWGNHKPSR